MLLLDGQERREEVDVGSRQVGRVRPISSLGANVGELLDRFGGGRRRHRSLLDRSEERTAGVTERVICAFRQPGGVRPPMRPDRR
jgi:hypothetical protein